MSNNEIIISVFMLFFGVSFWDMSRKSSQTNQLDQNISRNNLSNLQETDSIKMQNDIVNLVEIVPNQTKHDIYSFLSYSFFGCIFIYTSYRIFDYYFPDFFNSGDNADDESIILTRQQIYERDKDFETPRFGLSPSTSKVNLHDSSTYDDPPMYYESEDGKIFKSKEENEQDTTVIDVNLNDEGASNSQDNSDKFVSTNFNYDDSFLTLFISIMLEIFNLMLKYIEIL